MLFQGLCWHGEMATPSHERWKCDPGWLIVVCNCAAGSNFAIWNSGIGSVFHPEVVDCCVNHRVGAGASVADGEFRSRAVGI